MSTPFAPPPPVTVAVAPPAGPAPPDMASAPAMAQFTGPTDFGTLFTITSTPVTPRLAISLDARTKSGKTHWALFTAPDPIAIAFTDDGTEIVIDKARRAGRRIHALDLRYFKIEHRDGQREGDKALILEWQTKWMKFVAGCKAIAANKEIRTVVRDTDTEIWQLCQLAHFGKTDKIPQHLRTNCNSAYMATFRRLYARADLNIIMIHQAKKQYVGAGNDANWNGQWERDGMNKTEFMVDLALVAGWSAQQRQFYTTVPGDQTTRFGPQLSGKTWFGAESGFGYLGIECFPDTAFTPEVWGL